MLGGVYRRWLALTALSYSVVHHLGLLPDGLGHGPSGTRWADWLDLLVPWLVLVPAALAVRAAGASERTWAVLGAGVVAYAGGHGIHLAANSIGNVARSDTAHVWDETVGHLVWYAGVALVLAALARTMVGEPRAGALGHLLALAVGLTWASNAAGGGTVVPSLVIAIGAVAFGWRHRSGLAGVLVTGFVPAVLVLGVAVGAALGG